MPTVLRVGGFSFGIYPGDHDPPHVHVRYAGAAAILTIESETARHNMGMKQRDIAEAQRLVRAHRDELLLAWTRMRQGMET